MNALTLAELWLRHRPIRKLKEWRKRAKETKVLKGKLTYSALGSIIAILGTQILGDGVVTQADWQSLGAAVLALVGIYGRWRATRGV